LKKHQKVKLPSREGKIEKEVAIKHLELLEEVYKKK